MRHTVTQKQSTLNADKHTRTHRACVQRCIKQRSRGLGVKTCNPGSYFQQHLIKKTLFPQASSCPFRSRTFTSHQQLLNDMSLHLIFYSHSLHVFHIQQWCVQCWVPIVNCKYCVTVKKNKKTHSAANPTRSQRAVNKRLVVASRLAPTLSSSQWQKETMEKSVLGAWPGLPSLHLR